MSSSMWAWRVIVPGLGLAACLFVFYDSTRARPSIPRVLEGVSTTPKPDREHPEGARIVAEGRVAARPGAEVTLGTESGGTVAGMPAREKARVKRGDLLVEMLADDQKASLAEAEARLTEVEAELAYQKREYQRRARSATDSHQFETEIDASRRDYEVTAARRTAALAGIERCRSVLARARVTSPIDGVVLECFARPGEVVPPSSRLVTVCDLARVWVEAEVDEFDAGRIGSGDAVAISAEGYDATWEGTVEQVPDRVGERSVRPDDPGRPTDARVLLVKIAVAGPLPLKLGQKVEVEIRSRR